MSPTETPGSNTESGNPRRACGVRYLCAALAVVGALAPAVALLRGAGPRDVSGAAVMMMAIWGALPFVLAPVAIRVARRTATRGMVVGLVGLASLFGVLGHFAGFLPSVPNSSDSLSFLFIPVWQWPILILASVVARIAPPADQQP